MGLGEDISFQQFLLDLKIDEKTCILRLHYIIKEPTLFLKQKPNDICTNVFGIHIRPLWGANIDARYILDPHVATSYYIFFLTNIDKFVIQKMKIILDKCRHEQKKTSKLVKKLENALVNAQQMFIQQVIYIILSTPYTIQKNHFSL
jgi:hypothetical protein